MKRTVIVILFVLALILLALTVLINTAHAEPEADDPGIPWGDYRIIWRSSDLQHYKLEWISKGGISSQVEIKADCVEPELAAPKIGDVCERTGNQKFDCPGNTQTLRLPETVIQKCFAYLSKINKCPPCPVCPAGTDCVSCGGEE